MKIKRGGFLFWFMRRDNPGNGQWKARNENRCREILERIYLESFKSYRHPDIINPKTGARLELDCFNKKRNIALEYDGSQHRKRNEKWQTQIQFDEQVLRDKYKNKRCKKLGIHLIRIDDRVKYDDLKDTIIDELKNKNLLSRKRLRWINRMYKWI